ncbi:hypothetical protein [Roseospira goensis]|uniref:Uncharacterized protein n=1 Tax=Roseospira goensis TaxID=391922 RepID=A0A7W6RX88_9PROT|nr:hypothetical protein [Roseospira goensis]MBB4284410.1 hypothetical protein [Roseospira goensis]
MILIRFLGWIMIVVASVAASAEAVLALGPGARPALATGEIWTLLSGVPARTAGAPDHWLEVMAASVMLLPAWLAIGLLGLGFVLIGRWRRRKPRLSSFG